MGNVRNNQAGYTAIEGLLILVIVVILGFTGWFVWSAKQNTDKSLTSNNSTTPVIKKKTSTVEESSLKTSTTPKQSFLAIKEWGVKIPLSSKITTAYYSYSSGTDSVTVSLSKYKKTNCSADLGQLYSISRSTDASNNGVKIGNYYYSAVHPQAGCDGTGDGTAATSTWDSDSAGATEAMSYVSDIKTAIGQIVAE